MFERTEHPAADQNRELRNQASSSLCKRPVEDYVERCDAAASGRNQELGVRLNSEEPRLCGDSSEKRSTRPMAWEHGQDMWIAE